MRYGQLDEDPERNIGLSVGSEGLMVKLKAWGDNVICCITTNVSLKRNGTLSFNMWSYLLKFQ